MQKLGKDGPRAFYEGAVAESIVKAVHLAGGVMSTRDLSDHMNTVEPVEVEPLSTTYRGDFSVHTTPLPTQGAVLLQALNILDRVGVKGQFEHVIIEALRHAIGDRLRYIGHTETGGSLTEMLSPKRAMDCANMVDLDRRTDITESEEGKPQLGNAGTTFAAAADEKGNVCALIGSLSMFFGCAVVQEHGFCVQIRGLGFNQTPGHPNCFGPRKKPYHSLTPVMIPDAHTQDWLGTMGTSSGLPQTGILTQLLLNMVELGLDPQQSLSKPRFLIGSALRAHPDSTVVVDPGFPQEELLALQQRGHKIRVASEKLNFYHGGHANIMAKASLWSRLDVRASTTSQESRRNGLIWCGVEPCLNGVALGY
ncbi:hypothetical protein HPB50_021719 [Hyalomma asiaticum]|uniref:Uncharacterized protein n=1 Tax=Hyalomma asiaticum TaxID=266040 RepID=A0ACB7T974_HYAAI|nr:hypothetical protein HPB50_021719 [Hyalomma asiaticum]